MEIKDIELKDKNIIIFNDVDESTMSSAVEKIVQINQEDEVWIRNAYNALEISGAKFSKTTIEMPHIQVLLSTYGGCVYDGLSLYDVIKNSSLKLKLILLVLERLCQLVLSSCCQQRHERHIETLHL